MAFKKMCDRCGHFLIGNEKRGKTCNSCLEKSAETKQAAIAAMIASGKRVPAADVPNAIYDRHTELGRARYNLDDAKKHLEYARNNFMRADTESAIPFETAIAAIDAAIAMQAAARKIASDARTVLLQHYELPY